MSTSKLVYRPGQRDAREFVLTGVATVIGRAPECDVFIPHKGLSRRHAEIRLLGGRFFLVDLGSKNGSFVGGVQVQRQEIVPGDAIRLGDLSFSFAVETAAPESPPTRGSSPSAATSIMPLVTRDVSRVPIAELLGDDGAGGALKVRGQASTARDREKFQILLQTTRLLSSAVEVDVLLDKILELVFAILDVDRAAVLLADERTGKLKPRVTRPAGGGQPIYSRHIVEYVYTSRLAALFADAATDPRLAASMSIVGQSIRTSMCVPLMPSDDVIGVLYVDNLTVPNRFTEEDLDFLAAFASQAAVAIENARLYRRIEQETVHRMQLVTEGRLAALSSLTTGIAHELKNPLNFINNFAELAAELCADLSEAVARERAELGPEAAAEIRGPLDDLRQSLEKILTHGQRADGIVNGMLAHGRATSGAREPATLNAVMAESVARALADARHRLPGLSVRVDARYDEAVGEVEMAREHLHRALGNLVDNALQAMAEKAREAGAGYEPVLTVRTLDGGDHVDVQIGDNGTGIAPEIADKIYHPFFTTRRPGEGTGLGLSLSHAIITQGHQGRLSMRSTPGEGAEFVVTLPKQPITLG